MLKEITSALKEIVIVLVIVAILIAGYLYQSSQQLLITFPATERARLIKGQDDGVWAWAKINSGTRKWLISLPVDSKIKINELDDTYLINKTWQEQLSKGVITDVFPFHISPSAHAKHFENKVNNGDLHVSLSLA